MQATLLTVARRRWNVPESPDRLPLPENRPETALSKSANRARLLEIIRKRQRERARIFAWLLGAFAVLVFFITIAKTGMNW